MLSKQDILDWKSNPVTKTTFNAIRERIEEIKDELSRSEERVQYRQGYIQAMRDMLEIDVEETL